MAINLNKRPAEELKQDLIFERVDVNDLNLTQKNQRDAFLSAIKERPNLLTKVKQENAMHYLKPAIETDPINFVYLEKRQYNDELAEIYLSYRLDTKNESRSVNNAESSKWFTTHNSVDGKLILNYNYVTPNGEELYYYDNELQVPVSIKSNFKISLKVNHALTFIEKIDMHVTQLGKSKVESIIADLLDNQYRSVLSNYISKRKIGYYTLCTSINDFENELQNKLESVYKPYGIEVVDVIVRRFAIPKAIQDQIEDQAFEIRQLKADMNANHELAKKSLENYEAKLAIEQKYPDTEHTLTEYEKDLALKRYLVKTGQLSKEAIDRNINIKRQLENKDSVISKEKDIVPTIPPKKNPFKTGYFWLLIISLIINFIVLGNDTAGGLIFLGINVAIFGSIATIFYEKFKTEKVQLEDSIDSNSVVEINVEPTNPTNEPKE